MALTLLQPFNLDTTANYTFNKVTVSSNVDLSGAGNVNLGSVSNLHISGGTSGYVLSTDGSGTLSWISAGGIPTSIANGTSNVNIPTSNGNVTVGVAGNANIVVITGTGVVVNGTSNVTGNLSSGNADLGNLVTANYFTGTLTTGSQPNITSTGTLTSLTVTGNISSGNANLGNLVTANYVTGTLTTGNQPNITSTGTLTDLSVTGNAVVGGNLTVNGDLVYVNVTTLAVEDPIIQLQSGPNGAAPSSNSGKDVGTALNYYDTSAKIAFMGWDVSNAEFGFGNTVSISSEVITWTSYGNVRAGYFLGNGSQLTGTIANSNYAAYSGEVVDASQPNITSLGTLSGLTSGGTIDFTSASNVSLGAVGNVHITGGTNGYVLSTDGSGGLSWVAQSGGGGTPNAIANGTSNVAIPTANGNVNISVAGNANILTVTGTGANVAGTLYVNGVITGNANLDLGTNFILGNGYYIDGIAQATSAAAVANGTSNVNIPLTDGNIELSVDGNAAVLVVTGTGANVVGTFNVTGNTTLGNLTTGNGSGGIISGASNISTVVLVASGNITSANASLGNVATANYFTGTLTTGAQPNITSVGTLTGITSTGTVNLTSASNVSLGPVGNVKITGGTNGYVLSTDGSGTLSWIAQASGGTPAGSNTQLQFNDAGSFGGNANLTFDKSTSVFTVVGNITSTNANLGNLARANFITGTLTSSAQPNITSVGTLTSLTVGPNSSVILSGSSGFVKANSIQGTDGTAALYTFYGSAAGAAGVRTDLTVGAGGTGNLTVNGGVVNFTTSSNVSLGAVGNVKITGGTANYVLSTDGSGNLSWVAQSGGGGGGGSIGIATDTSNATFYPVFANTTTGNLSNVYVNTTGLTFNPSTGTLTVQDLNTLSDATLKEGAEIIEDPFTVLNQIFGMQFSWKNSGKKSYGVLAQMLEHILPELVSVNANGKKTVNYIPIIAFLVEAVKKQQQDIETLKKR